jgi:Ca2+-binding EF-hand superfamily protein
MKKEEQEANEALKTFDTKGEGAIELHKLKSIMTSLGEDTF